MSSVRRNRFWGRCGEVQITNDRRTKVHCCLSTLESSVSAYLPSCSVKLQIWAILRSTDRKTLIPMKCGRFVGSPESLCEMRWPRILLSDRLDLTAPITAYVEAFFTLMRGSVWSFLFVPPCYLSLSLLLLIVYPIFMLLGFQTHICEGSWCLQHFPTAWWTVPPPNNHPPSSHSSCPPPW